MEDLPTEPIGNLSDYESAAMARLRREAHARMLGNGLCTSPAELDCRMKSACETCAYFRTGTEFLPVLIRQRDHAHHPRPARPGNLRKNSSRTSISHKLDKHHPYKGGRICAARRS